MNIWNQNLDILNIKLAIYNCNDFLMSEFMQDGVYHDVSLPLFIRYL